MTIGIKLNDGTEHTWTVSKLPRHWKSWMMNKLPYCTDFQDCEFFKR